MTILISVVLAPCLAGVAAANYGDVHFTQPYSYETDPWTPGKISTLSAGGDITVIVDGLEYPSALCFDPSDNIYFADRWSGDVTRRAPDGTLTYIGDFKQNWPGGGFRIGWDGDVVANDSGQLFFNIQQDTGTSTPGNISVMDVSTGVLTELVGGLEYPSAISLAPWGDLYFADRWSGMLTKRAPDGTLTDIGNIWTSPSTSASIKWDLDIAASANGGVYFTVPTAYGAGPSGEDILGNVSVIDPDGVISVVIPDLGDPTGLVLDTPWVFPMGGSSVNETLYVVERGSGTVKARSFNGTVTTYPGSVWDNWAGGGTRIGWDLDIAVLLSPGGKPGDFNGDGDIDADDIDLLGDAIRLGLTDPLYDISADGTTHGPDGVIDILDLDYLVRFLVEAGAGVGTEYGDFNLDGLIDTTDLTRLATDFGSGDTWAKGNASRNVDLITDVTDLTILSTYYGFGVPDIVPEPATLSLLALGALAMLRRRKS